MAGVKLRDILNIPVFAKARVLAGKRGLNKHVTTASVAEVPDILAWAKEGALYLTTLYAFRSEDDQRNLIEGLLKKGAAGLVVKPKRFLDSVPSEMINQAQRLNFPLIEISPEVAWSELIPGIFEKILEEEAGFKARESFLEAILAEDYVSEEAILRRGESIGCNLADPHRVLVVDIDNFSLYLAQEKPAEDDVQKKKAIILSLIQEELEKRSMRYFMLQRSDSFIAMVDAQRKQDLDEAVRAICSQAKEHIRPLTISIGMGDTARGPAAIRRSFAEAVKALRVVHLLKGGDSAAEFKEVEDYVVLANLADAPELDRFLRSALGKLTDYDSENKTALFETLRTYFLCGENKAEAARRLFVHLNTLKYRLQKIEELLGVKLHDPEDSFRLKLAVRLVRFKHRFEEF